MLIANNQPDYTYLSCNEYEGVPDCNTFTNLTGDGAFDFEGFTKTLPPLKPKVEKNVRLNDKDVSIQKNRNTFVKLQGRPVPPKSNSDEEEKLPNNINQVPNQRVNNASNNESREINQNHNNQSKYLKYFYSHLKLFFNYL